ncbi:uncharacterized protein A4U43_C04F17070 [Asparagus officinalis]|uniref:HMA domain-containing protein n=1 Tax=Asparagus officinalis TaxID=4686 RepID=A0A5P1F1I0_ASPOF|nr:heavy metal-associated isoprenylated plant protein 4-like [Asparagus officinalis]ONK72218.1 uncharacterized protein A4U43_C04F17070 [Asparagus officinalis]
MGDKVKAEEVKAKTEEVTTAVYKLNLHCPECAHAVEKTVVRTSGVQKVDTDVESGKVTVKGNFDVKKIQELIAKKSRKKVELISPKPKEKEEKKEEKIEKKEVVAKTTVIKVHMHCEKCEQDLKWKLLKLKGIHSVKMNRDAEICTIVGTVEEKKLVEYIRKKLRKHGEIVPQKKEEKKEEKKGEVKESKEVKVAEVVEKKVTEMSEKKEEVKTKEIVVPYFIHCTHAPEWFSDENPNACFVM